MCKFSDSCYICSCRTEFTVTRFYALIFAFDGDYMIDNIVNLFTSLFSSCLIFSDILLFMSAVALCSVIVTVIVYLAKGKY